MTNNGNGFPQKAFQWIVAPLLAILIAGFVNYTVDVHAKLQELQSDITTNCHDINGLRERLREIILLAAQDGETDPAEAERAREFTREAIGRLESEEC